MVPKVKRTWRKVILTPHQKIEVLQLAKRKLGPGGKNWIRNHWYGKRDSMNLVIACSSREATCFCLEGAVEIAAMELGYTDKAIRGATVARATSITNYVRKKHNFPSVNRFNDQKVTEWKDVLGVINGRISELRKEIA